MRALPDVVRAVAGAQEGLVTTAQALRAGMTFDDIRTERRRGYWQTLLRGVHLVDADLYGDGLREPVWWRAALLAHGPDFCLVATTAAQAYGLVGLPANPTNIEIGRIGGAPRHCRDSRDATMSVPTAKRRVVVRQLMIAADQVVQVNGLAMRDAFHTVVDAALVVDRMTALCLIDSALHLELLTPDSLCASIEQARHRPGIITVRELAAFADGRAESQVESRVRLACIDGGAPPDDLQHLVRDSDGNPIARGDMAWLRQPRRPLLGEADGESVHSLPTPVYRDRSRGNALVSQAYDTVRFTYADTFKRGYIPYVVKAALNAA